MVHLLVAPSAGGTRNPQLPTSSTSTRHNTGPSYRSNGILAGRDIHRPLGSYAQSYPQRYPPVKNGRPRGSPDVEWSESGASRGDDQGSRTDQSFVWPGLRMKGQKSARIRPNWGVNDQLADRGSVSRETRPSKSSRSTRVSTPPGQKLVRCRPPHPQPGPLINKVIHNDIHRCSRTFQQRFVRVNEPGPWRRRSRDALSPTPGAHPACLNSPRPSVS